MCAGLCVGPETDPVKKIAANFSDKLSHSSSLPKCYWRNTFPSLPKGTTLSTSFGPVWLLFGFWLHNIASRAEDTNCKSSKNQEEQCRPWGVRPQAFFLIPLKKPVQQALPNFEQQLSVVRNCMFPAPIPTCWLPANSLYAAGEKLCGRVVHVYHTANKLRQGTMRLLRQDQLITTTIRILPKP